MYHVSRLAFMSLLALAVAASCSVGPDYKRPTTVKPAAFKEAQGWKQADPKDTAPRGKWWEVFQDPDLNALEEQIAVSNQTVKAAEAQFRQARAVIAEARSSYFPVISADVTARRAGTGASNRSTLIPSAISTTTGTTTSTTATTNTTATTSNSSSISSQYNASLDASWELDVWGRVRRTVESNKALAEATAADLASIQLSMQSELAMDYFNLRLADEQKRFLDSSVEAYKKSLQLTQNLYNAGVQARSDVLQANVQLKSTEAQAIDVGVQRTQYEHAIAVLIGKAPSEFSITSATIIPIVPVIPLNVPSELLERRPDIAAAERRVISANARIGVAEAAYFPDLTLSATGGYQSSSFSHWFSLPNRVWSIGPSLVETVFDAGLRTAQTEEAIAAYDVAVANYRQTVLAAFQEVEDNLSAMRILEEEAAARESAVKDSSNVVAINLNQYKAGIVSYISVTTAQNAELTNKLSELAVARQRLTSAATLIKALGGGWESAELNKPEVTTPQTTPFSFFPPARHSTPDAPQATPMPK